MKYCPDCQAELVYVDLDDRERLLCSTDNCGFVHWDNPVPVVAAIVEYQGQVVLANNMQWPEHVFALITGFLEKDESPEQGVVREVGEELGLQAVVRELVGVYPFFRKNQLIIAYHVEASGEIRLNHELRSYRCVDRQDLTYWDAGTGHALRDWLNRQGYEPPLRPLR